MKVDLPAPFGPSRPVTPGGTETLTSLRPMTWPYHFETCSAVTIGVIVLSRGFAPRTPLHALSLAAAPARSDRVARSPLLARASMGPHLLIRGLRPSDSPTRALARRCAGSLRPRGPPAPPRSPLPGPASPHP